MPFECLIDILLTNLAPSIKFIGKIGHIHVNSGNRPIFPSLHSTTVHKHIKKTDLPIAESLQKIILIEYKDIKIKEEDH